MENKKSYRTQLQIVTGAEDTWLAQFLVPTEIYICPTDAMAKVRRGGTR